MSWLVSNHANNMLLFLGELHWSRLRVKVKTGKVKIIVCSQRAANNQKIRRKSWSFFTPGSCGPRSQPALGGSAEKESFGLRRFVLRRYHSSILILYYGDLKVSICVLVQVRRKTCSLLGHPIFDLEAADILIFRSSHISQRTCVLCGPIRSSLQGRSLRDANCLATKCTPVESNHWSRAILTDHLDAPSAANWSMPAPPCPQCAPDQLFLPKGQFLHGALAGRQFEVLIMRHSCPPSKQPNLCL